MSIRLHGLALRHAQEATKEQYENDCMPIHGAGAPSDATFSGAPSGQGGRGCQYVDTDTGYIWVNEGTKASPSLGFTGTQVST